MLVALTEAVFKGYWIKPKAEREDDDFDGVQILSISSCVLPSGDFAHFKRRSFVRWIKTLFDAYSNGQSKSDLFFIDQIKSHLDFEVNITRVENAPLSSIQAKKVSMDKVGKSSMSILQGLGSIVGNNAKNNEVVKQLYSEKKTIDVTKFKTEENGK